MLPTRHRTGPRSAVRALLCRAAPRRLDNAGHLVIGEEAHHHGQYEGNRAPDRHDPSEGQRDGDQQDAENRFRR